MYASFITLNSTVQYYELQIVATESFVIISEIEKISKCMMTIRHMKRSRIVFGEITRCVNTPCSDKAIANPD